MVFFQRVIKAVLISPLVASILTLSLPAHTIAVSDQAIVALTNSMRHENGLQALSWSPSLASAAWMKALDMCEKDYWAHTAPSGATGWTFMSKAGYKYIAAGENLAKGFANETSVVAGWMASPRHRANIVNSAYKDIGVGVATCSFEGVDTTFIVAHYGTTK